MCLRCGIWCLFFTENQPTWVHRGHYTQIGLGWMCSSIDLYRLATCMCRVIRKVFHVFVMLDFFLQLGDFYVKSFHGLFFLSEFDNHLFLFTFEQIQLFLACLELILCLNCILLYLFRKVYECFQFLLKLLNFRLTFSQLLLVFQCSF